MVVAARRIPHPQNCIPTVFPQPSQETPEEAKQIEEAGGRNLGLGFRVYGLGSRGLGYAD